MINLVMAQLTSVIRNITKLHCIDATDVARSMVSLSVCMLVTSAHYRPKQMCKNNSAKGRIADMSPPSQYERILIIFIFYNVQ